MSKTLRDLQAKKLEAVAAAREVLDRSRVEGKMNPSDQAKYDEIFANVNEFDKQISNEQRQIEIERSTAEFSAQAEKIATAGKDSNEARSFITSGKVGKEIRALQADSDVVGGYLVMPEMFVNQLIKFVDDNVVIRNLATKFRVANAQKLGAPSLDVDISDADWTTELSTGNEDSDIAFGKRELNPHPIAKRIKVSKKLMQLAVMNPESMVAQRMAYKFGITQEKAFMTGDGNQKPLGLFVASNNGIGTSRDVSTGNTTTGVTFDGLVNAKFSLKSNYLPQAKWIFNRAVISQISQLKDLEGRYLWEASRQVGQPDMLLGIPVLSSEYAPSTLTTGQYVGMIGDFSNYWIADAMDVEMQRLGELYAETNQIGFIGRQSTDGMPVLAEAFARVKLT